MKTNLEDRIVMTVAFMDKCTDIMYYNKDLSNGIISNLFLRARSLESIDKESQYYETELKDSYTFKQFYDILFAEYMPRIAKFLQKIIKLYAKCQKLDLNDIYIKDEYDKYANKYITPIVCGISSMTTTKKDK